MTMTLVSTVTVGAGGAASIDFTSIPQTGTDLYLLVSSRHGISADYNLLMNFNGSSASFTTRSLQGTGSSVASTAPTANYMGYMNGANTTTNTFSSHAITLPNYSGATNKSISVDCVQEQNGSFSYAQIIAGLRSNTAAITSLSIYPEGGSFVQYSTASLYTITKGSGGASVS